MDGNIRDLRSIFLLGFYGLFTISQSLDEQVSDVAIHDQFLEILVKSRKTGQYSGKVPKSLFLSSES